MREEGEGRGEGSMRSKMDYSCAWRRGPPKLSIMKQGTKSSTNNRQLVLLTTSPVMMVSPTMTWTFSSNMAVMPLM